MVDEEVVRARLSRLENALRHLETLTCKPREEFVSSWELHGLAERELEVASQACIDIANHLIAAEGLRAPDGYADVFQVLSDTRILQQDLADRMKSIAGLRNILVHDYLVVDHELLHDQMQDLSDFRAFAKAIRHRVWK